MMRVGRRRRCDVGDGCSREPALEADAVFGLGPDPSGGEELIGCG